MDVSYSVLNNFFKFKQFQFSQETENISVEDMLLPVFQHGFIRSEKNVDLHNFQHYGVNCW